MGRDNVYLTVRRFCVIVGAACLLWLLIGLGCVFVGPVRIEAARIISILFGAGGGVGGAEFDIVMNQRVPRVALACLAGGGLAVTGAVFQAMLRNPLATPHTLGVSAGGALGAVLAISLDAADFRLGPVSSLQLFALLGALLNVSIIYLLARKKGGFSTLKLLLAGVTLGLICSAMIMFLRYLSDPFRLVVLDRWLMGGVSVLGYRSLASVLPLFLPALALLFLQAGALNQISFGEELAGGRGINVEAAQLESFLAGSVLTASVVSVVGPIGFVGLIVPHLLRLLLGPDHRLLLFVSFFGGGAFLAIADTAARTVFAPSEMPVGVLTAMLGGPFFLMLLVRKV